MRALRPGVARHVLSIGASLIAFRGLPAQQPQWALYPATLQFGAGLVDIPVAWVSPNSSDIWLQTSMKQIPYNGATQPALPFASRWNSNLSVDTHWGGRVAVGLSLYSQNPDWGFFGRVLVLGERPGRAWPAVAVGFRNLGSFTHEDRLLVGHDVVIDSSGAAREVTASYAGRFHTAPSVYGVATKSFAVGDRGAASLSIGVGSGLFADDGDLGRAYNARGQVVRGMFFGGRYAIRTSPTTRIDLLAENNGWDWNAGIVGTWRGISVGIYGTELEEGGKSPAKGALYTVYNYAKLNVALGYNGNLHDIASGTLLRARAGELERERARLRAELRARERRVETLEGALREARAAELAEVAKRREELERQIEEERAAIRRAQERLEALQQGRGPAKPPEGGTPRGVDHENER